MSDEQRSVYFQTVEQLGQSAQRLLVHESWRSCGSEPVRLTVAKARIDERTRTEPAGDLVWKIAPQGHAAQTLVQEDKGMLRHRVAEQHAIFYSSAVERREGHEAKT